MFEFSEHHSDQNTYIQNISISVHLLPYNACACVRALVRVCVRVCSVRRSVRVSAFELPDSVCFNILFLLLYL